MSAPKGIYHGEFTYRDIDVRYRATGEFRCPKSGEFYLSGAVITAYKTINGLSDKYWIAEPVQMVRCSHCNGTGKVMKS